MTLELQTKLLQCKIYAQVYCIICKICINFNIHNHQYIKTFSSLNLCPSDIKLFLILHTTRLNLEYIRWHTFNIKTERVNETLVSVKLSDQYGKVLFHVNFPHPHHRIVASRNHQLFHSGMEFRRVNKTRMRQDSESICSVYFIFPYPRKG